eukprot:TRINITY_DN8601_c0_g1_i1.p1 TRINITY_DN8601_c0_g1~~TRINITY_DN8601_c0_g1_i1.p1  ORF type:complete len:777 (-),score=138.76 TRINITY_DN8601_c0_g1_i1:75-2405(-)
MQLEVRVYGARNLRFSNPFGIWEASCLISLEIVTHTAALPKTAPKIKNANPVWNKAVHFDIDSPKEKTLTITINETSDQGQQTPIANASIPLETFQGLVGGQEGRRTFPLQNGAELDIGVIFRLPSFPAGPNFSPQQQQFGAPQRAQSFQGPPQPQQAGNPFSGPGQGPAPNPFAAKAGFPSPSQPSFAQAGSGAGTAAAGRKRTETIGPFSLGKQMQHHSQHGVVNYAPEDLSRTYPHLARGSFGIVFKGWARDVPQQVVIKDMDIQNEGSILEWQKEIDIMAQTKSAYIAEVFGYSRHENTLTIVMEFMANGDLFGILHKYPEKHPLSLIQRMRMARHCCLGLQVLHEHNFIHRDIKSMNILINEEYTCKLTDFGCSKLSTGNNFLHTANTGTPLWMAPEVKRGQYSFSSDVYSMGLVLYELFEKCLPAFDQNTGITSLPKQFQSAPVVLPCVNPNPEARPNVEKLLTILDGLVRKIVGSVKSSLGADEQAMLEEAVNTKMTQAAASGQPTTVMEATLLSLYQYLLRKPAEEADELINKALGITTPPPKQQQQNDLMRQHGMAPSPSPSPTPTPAPAPGPGPTSPSPRGAPGAALTGSASDPDLNAPPGGRGRGAMSPRGRGALPPRGRGGVSGRGRGNSATLPYQRPPKPDDMSSQLDQIQDQLHQIQEEHEKFQSNSGIGSNPASPAPAPGSGHHAGAPNPNHNHNPNPNQRPVYQRVNSMPGPPNRIKSAIMEAPSRNDQEEWYRPPSRTPRGALCGSTGEQLQISFYRKQ